MEPLSNDSQRLFLAERLSWGPRGDLPVPDSADPAAALGVLADAPLPPAAAEQIAALRITQQSAAALVQDAVARNRAADVLADPAAKAAAHAAVRATSEDVGREVIARMLLRALYAPGQLAEQMTWFWANHFSVHARKRQVALMLGQWEDVLRRHALGRFRDLLAATVRAPAMLQYLDNDQNAVGHINENYAREIMELHTMGVGSGYSQRDVTELARVLTGVGVRANPELPRLPPDRMALYRRDGLFEFNPQRHDFGTKQLLGQTIHGTGWAEIDTAVATLANAPATRLRICQKLAQFWLGQPGPPPLIVAMTEAWRESDGSIAAVMTVLLRSDAFRRSLGQAFKDPLHYVVSAVRYAYGGRVIRNTDPMIGWLRRLGQEPYGRATPDGYPIEAAAWTGPGQMDARFEIAKAIGNGSAGLFRARTPGSADEPAFPQLQNALWYSGYAATIGAQTRAVLVSAASSQQWNMLLLASPEFMRR